MPPTQISYQNPVQGLVPVILSGLTILLLSACPIFGQNLLKNGDFETPPFAPSSDITEWVVSGTGHVHEIAEGATSPAHSAALNVGHDSQGTVISQTFPTAVGEVYRVDFDSAIFGEPSSAPLQLNVQITGNGTLLNQTVTPPSAFTFDPDQVLFAHYYFTFTANSSTSTIVFTDIGVGNADADTLVDSVSVQPEENLLANGDFETGPFNSAGAVTAWTVGGNNQIIDRSDEGSVGGTHAAAFNAGSDSTGNVLTQSVLTTVGKRYLLDFYVGVFGIPDSGTVPQLHVELTGSDMLLNDTVTPPVTGTFDPTMVHFQHYQYSFVATSASTTLQFDDIGIGNANADIMLDAVSIEPEPTELANGDFEAAPFDTLAITGWTLSGNGLMESKAEGATTPTHSAAFGTGGNSQGNILSQTFPTIIGRQYALDFDSGIFGIPSGSPLQLQIQVIGNGAILNQLITPPAALTFTPANVMFQRYHFIFTANTNSTTLQFQDLGTGNTNADSLIDTVSLQLQPPATFARWESTFFTPTQLNDPAVTGWSADPDHDGIKNGLEYFFNTNPLVGIPLSEAAALPKVSISTSGNSSYLTLTYHRLIGYRGTPEIVAVSDNLVSWDETGSQIEQVGGSVPTGDGLTETVTVRLKTPINQGPIPRKFLRLELSQ